MKNHIILAGIPGTGKTTTGEYMSKHFGFSHYNFENETTFKLYAENKQKFISHARRQSGVIITWGFVPTKHIRNILSIQNRGFSLVWFDGDRAAAFREFTKRGTATDEMFYHQMIRIIKRKVVERLSPKIIDPFDSLGQFRPLDELCKELIAYSARISFP